MKIRPFEPRDIDNLVELWNRALPLDGIALSTFERKVLLDENFLPQGLLVAEETNQLVGFIYGVVRNVPMPGLGLEETKGWITAWGIAPEHRKQGFGKALLEKVLQFFKDTGRKQVIVSTYAPNYFVPGVDFQAYPAAMALLGKLGFEQWAEFLSMDASIVQFSPPTKALTKEKALVEQGIEVRFYQRKDLPLYLKFQREHMPPDWLLLARHNLIDLTRGLFEPDQIVIAVDKGEIVGFCQHEREHFGPFGVAEQYQGRGIGTVLLAKMLERMHQKGLHCAWLLWTGERAAKGIYGPLGFRVTRRFAAMKKKL